MEWPKWSPLYFLYKILNEIYEMGLNLALLKDILYFDPRFFFYFFFLKVNYDSLWNENSLDFQHQIL